jgi:DNA polymerase Ligase (LigD)
VTIDRSNKTILFMPRFAILEHDHPDLHWDLMLELEDTLKTFKLSSPPACDTVMQIKLQPDHRKLYLDYEGPISGDRGSVTRWDSGTFEWLQEDEDHLKVRLSGHKLLGVAEISQTPQNQWELNLQST